MERLILAAVVLCLAGLGIWIMHGIDRFLADGGLRPHWSRNEETVAIEQAHPAESTCGSTRGRSA